MSTKYFVILWLLMKYVTSGPMDCGVSIRGDNDDILNLRGSRNLGKIIGQFLAHSPTFRC